MSVTAQDMYAIESGLGALPGPGLLDELLAQAETLNKGYSGLEEKMAALQTLILDSTAVASSRTQGSLVNELEGTMRTLQQLRSTYRASVSGLSNFLGELRTMKTKQRADTISTVGIVAGTARFALLAPGIFGSVKYVLAKWPSFEAKTLQLIQQARLAPAKPQGVPLSAVAQSFTKSLPQVAMWVTIAAGLFALAPLMKKLR